MPKEVEAHLPDGRVLTVQGVPDEMTPDEFKTQFRQRHPEYFGANTPPASSQTAGAGDSFNPQASLANAVANARKSLNESAPGQFLSRAGDIVKGMGETFDPRQTLSAMTHGDIADAIANTPIYRMAHGVVESEKEAAPQVKQQFIDAAKDPDPYTRFLRGLGGSVTAASMADPFATPSVTNVNKLESQGNNKAAIGQGGADIVSLLAGKKAPQTTGTVSQLFKGELESASHAKLGQAATEAKRLVGQGGEVHQNISKQFEKLSNDVAAADYAKGDKISLASIWDQVLEHADAYGKGKTTPNFNAIAEAIEKRPVEVSFKEAHDLLKEIDRKWLSAKEGTPDAGAASQIRQSLSKTLDNRAAELGRSQQWQAAKNIWRTLRQYQGDGVLSKLINTGVDPVVPGGVTEGGKSFFDTLRDPANKPKLQEINRAFEPYGLPKNYFTDLAQKYAPFHDYLNTISTSSKLKLLAKHPVSGGAGFMGGMVAGAPTGHPFITGALGAIKGAKLGASIPAARAFAEMGRVPEVTPLAEESKVSPVGTGEKPTPPAAQPGAVNMNELTDALKSLGYKKDVAASMAKQAIAEHPNDFNSALKRAMQGPQKTPAAKAQAIQQIKPVSGGSQAADINVPPSRQGIVKSGPKSMPMAQPPRTAEMIRELRAMEEAKISNRAAEKQARALHPKSINSHNDAFQAAKEEWMAKNPGKDPANHASEIARRAENLRKGK